MRTANARNPGARRRCAVLGVGLLWLLLACSEAAPPRETPNGNWIVGDRAALASLVDALEALEGTPVSRFASSFRARFADCDRFVLHGAPGESLEGMLERGACGERMEVPAALEAELADTDTDLDALAVFSFEREDGSRIFGRWAEAAAGQPRLHARFDPGEGTAKNPAMALLVQGDEPAGEPGLRGDDALVHARIRPAGGLDLASLVSQGSQADQMFQLRSELFMGALLDGAWELAIYLPRPDQVTPPVALSLDHTIRAGAERAMQTFVQELENTWPIHHSAREIAGHPGACFHDLKLLPDLVPCYVVSERSIVIGWNPESISLALGEAAGPPTFAAGRGLDERGGWLVHFDRFPEADRRLQRQLHGRASGPGLAGLFDALHANARERDGGVSLEARFERDVRVGAAR